MIKIREMRKKVGMTQLEFSELLNVGQSTVAMWENGENAPRLNKLPEIAKILGCEIADLFDDGKFDEKAK